MTTTTFEQLDADRAVTNVFTVNGLPYQVVASWIGDQAYGSHVTMYGEQVTDIPEANGTLVVTDEPVTDPTDRQGHLAIEIGRRRRTFTQALRRQIQAERDEVRAMQDAHLDGTGQLHWSDPRLDDLPF